MKLVLAALLVTATLTAVMNFSQTDLLFPTHAVPPAGPMPPGAAELELTTEGGERLYGVHIPPTAGGEDQRTLILGFGGNAWNGQEVATYLHQVFPEADVVAFHYRGYRPSTGSPSADALIHDAPLVLDYAAARIRPERTFAVGFSIGSGVAASLAGSGKLDGLVLVTPFDSLKKVASSLYPWLPIGTFFQHELNIVGFLDGAEVPVAVLAAERDEIIPPARTEALRARIANLAFDRTIPAAGHNDIYSRDEFEAALREALNAVAEK